MRHTPETRVSSFAPAPGPAVCSMAHNATDRRATADPRTDRRARALAPRYLTHARLAAMVGAVTTLARLACESVDIDPDGGVTYVETLVARMEAEGVTL
jgi:hypothetical protein